MTVGPLPMSGGLARRLRRGAVGAGALLDVARAVLPSLAAPGLRVVLVDHGDGDPLLLVEEEERSAVVAVADLADEMTCARVLPTAEGIAAALRLWVDRRPVPDGVAAAAGTAVLDWCDAGQTRVGWTVVAVRGQQALPWEPSPGVDPSAVHRTRSAALGRAFEVPLDFGVDGPIAVWWNGDTPLLGTAGLVDPARMRRDAAGAGLDTRNALVVVSPGRPVVVAAPSIARRLTEETPEHSVMLPWSELADLPWA
ncbi:hypothetical protein GB931_16680 [Modestobacter sp. I12A-02628]|uniref:Uncharacterized protein n=1 Tax=Goekera deserti TaxID=2497753 RepID=A0A7K3WCJ2_9ACTN|nr:hypothetical protein [Goekera deserti]MPQ99521.1 hypothetical protein [Goekera deserti]NDI49008.1 hypothetical protein [Goekera deserti]NEL54201.1 hypothetical protein [Goekera deserti]